MPTTIEAKFRIVTPMFIGGAEQTPTDGIRPPSLKGALRFWWRALNWGRIRQSGMNDYSALKKLHHEEAQLFGSAAANKDTEETPQPGTVVKNNNGGQGQFLLRLQQQPKRYNINDWPQNNTDAGYMAYGILESGDRARDNYQPHRTGLNEKQEFTVELVFCPRASPEDIAQITDTLDIFGWCGGLGSRSQRGMGSVSLVSLNKIDHLLTQAEYEQRMAKVLEKFASVSMPLFTAFSSEARFRLLVSPRNNAISAIEAAGQAFKDHRSLLRGRVKIPFGLPLQNADDKNRRASPLFFHVQALKDNQFIGTVLYLPAVPFHHVHPNVNYNVVRAFA